MPDSFSKIPPEVIGALMACIMAVLRVVYDKEETRPARIALEGFICGGLSLTASSGMHAAGLGSDWSVFVGGVIGYLGSTTVRRLSVKAIKKRTGGDN